jgi:ribonucleoside-diphosphate reductase alpha chain
VLNTKSQQFDQLGVRKGALAIYLDIWHQDVEVFIDLKKTHQDVKNICADLFPALWIPDVFFERLLSGEEWWYLFSSHGNNALLETHGEEFTAEYNKQIIEADNNPKKRQRLNIKELWTYILNSGKLTGAPWITFSCNANNANPLTKIGKIMSSNLCTEIFQNTFDFKYGRTDVLCNLGSLNMSKFGTDVSKYYKMEKPIKSMVYLINSSMTIAKYRTVSERLENSEKVRGLGIGLMGEAHWCALNKLIYGSEEHMDAVDIFTEHFSYYVYKASMQYAIDFNIVPTQFKHSEYANGNWFEKERYINSSISDKWKKLRSDVMKNGMANCYLMAIAPTSSISLVSGTTPSIEPIFKKYFIEENLSGNVAHMVPDLNKDTAPYYVEAYDIDQINLVKVAARRFKWIDQGGSLNLFIDECKYDINRVSELYMTAWLLGIKSKTSVIDDVLVLQAILTSFVLLTKNVL